MGRVQHLHCGNHILRSKIHAVWLDGFRVRLARSATRKRTAGLAAYPGLERLFERKPPRRGILEVQRNCRVEAPSSASRISEIKSRKQIPHDRRPIPLKEGRLRSGSGKQRHTWSWLGPPPRSRNRSTRSQSSPLAQPIRAASACKCRERVT